MRSLIRVGLPVALGLLLLPTSQAEELSQLRTELDVRIAALAGTVVRENISRYSQTGQSAHKIDDFDAMVEVTGGAEQYSGVQRNGVKYEHVSQIDGMWSFGELATLLRTTRDSLDDCSLKTAFGRTEDGSILDLVTFRSLESQHRWFVTANLRVYWLEFRGEIRTSRLTGQIVSVRWIAARLPPAAGIESIRWSVDFKPVEIAGRVYVMPQTAEYRVVHTGSGHRTDWNVTKFREWGRYGSEVWLHFDEAEPGPFPP